MRALQLLLPAGAWVGVARSPSGRGAVYLQPQRYPCALVSIRGDGHTAAQLPGRGAKPIPLSVMQTITDRLLGGGGQRHLKGGTALPHIAWRW